MEFLLNEVPSWHALPDRLIQSKAEKLNLALSERIDSILFVIQIYTIINSNNVSEDSFVILSYVILSASSGNASFLILFTIMF